MSKMEDEQVHEDSELEESEQESEESTSTSTRFSIQAKVSALLFSSSRPLSLKKLAECLEIRADKIERALEGLKELYSEEIHGFTLEEVSGSWQFRTASGLSHVVRRLHPPKSRRISRAAAETLAVIAYKQPVQRAEIDAIRGVDALPTIKTLLDAKLVRIVGKEDVAGTPALYGTTDLFLEKFGMNDLSELPSLRELEEIESDPGEVEQRDSEEYSDIPQVANSH